MNDWVPVGFKGWLSVFSQIASVGVNYIVLAFYNSWRSLHVNANWKGLSKEYRQYINHTYPNTRLFLAFNSTAWPAKNFIFDEASLTEFVIMLVEYVRTELFDGIDLHPGKVQASDGEAIVCAFSYITFLAKKRWPEAIISHSPQAFHFGPLVETVEETNRNAVLTMFENGRFMSCYRKHLVGTSRSNIPAPDSSAYRRP